jgi:O-antigen/teichoic acid export membrane protein
LRGLNDFWNRLKSNPFLKDVAKLATGTAVGQLLVILSTPVITRLYSPSEFGYFALFMSLVGFLSVIGNLKLDVAIVSANDESEASTLLLVCLMVSLPMACVGGLVTFTAIEWSYLSYGKLPDWSALVITLVLLLNSLFVSVRYWLVRHGEYAKLSQILILQGLGRSVTPILMGLLRADWFGLILGEMVGRSVGVIQLVSRVMPMIKKHLKSLNRADMVSVLSKNWKFPLIVLPSSLIDALAAALPLPLITSFYGPAAAGQFFLAQRLVSLPSSVISASIADVFFSNASVAYRSDVTAVATIFWSTARKLLMISGIIYLLAITLTPWFFVYIFGSQWAIAGKVVMILSALYFVIMVVSPLSRLLFVFNRPEPKFFIDVLLLTLPLAGIWLMFNQGYDFLFAVVAYAVMRAFCFGMYFLLIFYVGVRNKES